MRHIFCPTRRPKALRFCGTWPSHSLTAWYHTAGGSCQLCRSILPPLLFLLSASCLPKEDPNCRISPPSLTCSFSLKVKPGAGWVPLCLPFPPRNKYWRISWHGIIVANFISWSVKSRETPARSDLCRSVPFSLPWSCYIKAGLYLLFDLIRGTKINH